MKKNGCGRAYTRDEFTEHKGKKNDRDEPYRFLENDTVRGCSIRLNW